MNIHHLIVSAALPIFLTASAVAASAASIESNTRVLYQNELLSRTLSAADTRLCDNRVGPKSEDNAALYDQCRVTRLFVVDINAKKAVVGAPPMLKSQFLDETEYPLVAAALKGVRK